MQRGSRSTSTRPSTDRFPSLKIDFKEFSGESEDWNTWSRVHYAQLSALGCAAALTAQGDDDLKIGRSDFTDDEADPEQLRTAHQAWVSLITTCKGVAFDIVQGAESPGAAWSGLMQHYRASGLKERRRLTVDFYTMKMELGEHPRKFLLRVDQMVKELERVDRPVDSKDIDIVILSGLTPQYDAEVRMLESSADWPTRDWIERAVINQFERLESEKSAAGSKAMFAGRGNGHGPKPLPRCQICSRIGHTAQGCKEFRDLKKGQKTSDGNDGENGGRRGGNNKSKPSQGQGAQSRRRRKHSRGARSRRRPIQQRTTRVLFLRCRAHRSDDCPNRAEACDTAYGSGPKRGAFAGSLRGSLGAGLYASSQFRVGTDLPVTRSSGRPNRVEASSGRMTAARRNT